MNNFNFKNENLLIIFVISKQKNVLISAIDRNIYIFSFEQIFLFRVFQDLTVFL